MRYSMAETPVEIKGSAKEAKEDKQPKHEEQKHDEPKRVEPKPVKAVASDVKRIVRIATTDVDGTLPTVSALRRIRGINFMFANAVCRSTGIDGRKLIGALNEKEVETLQNFILNPSTLPKWMINRRKDPATGTDSHIVGTTLTFRQREDINFMKRIRCRRGIRHELGLPVRGQHTKSTGRHGRGVGVIRKTAAAAAAPVAAAKPTAMPSTKAAPTSAPKSAAAKPAAKTEAKK